MNWQQKYYPIPAKDACSSGLEAIRHSVLKWSGMGDILNTLPGNPLPYVIVLHPHLSNAAPGNIAALASRLNSRSEIDSARVDDIWLKKLQAMMILAKRLVYSLGVILILGAGLIIMNATSAMIKQYEQEILVLSYLGARYSYIRRPYVFMGVAYGVLGALVASCFIGFMSVLLKKPWAELSLLNHNTLVFQGLNAHDLLNLIAMGAIVGYLSAWMSFKRYQHDVNKTRRI